MSNSSSVIFHLDMDSFFASVESNRRDIKDEPIVVCVYSGRSEDSGAVSTTNYDAREYGIEAGMPIKRAKKIAKKYEEETGQNFHFFPVDKDYYSHVSEEIRDTVLESYTDKIEQASIDEFYMDLSDRVEDIEGAEKLAEEIKDEVKKKFDLTCSIGVASNKLVAKIASDRNKPDGITVVPEEKIEDFMYSLDLSDVVGIGKKTIERLSSLDINSVRELAEAEEKPLIEEFGKKLGPKLIEKAKGVGSTEVEEREQKQISRITTLKENSGDYDYISNYLSELAEQLEERVNEKSVFYRTVVLITIDTDLQMRTRSTTMRVSSKGGEEIFEKGKELLKEFLENFDGELRRVGLKVGKLEKARGQKKLGEFSGD